MQSSRCDERFGVSHNRTPNTNKFFLLTKPRGKFPHDSQAFTYGESLDHF